MKTIGVIEEAATKGNLLLFCSKCYVFIAWEKELLAEGSRIRHGESLPETEEALKRRKL